VRFCFRCRRSPLRQEKWRSITVWAAVGLLRPLSRETLALTVEDLQDAAARYLCAGPKVARRRSWEAGRLNEDGCKGVINSKELTHAIWYACQFSLTSKKCRRGKRWMRMMNARITLPCSGTLKIVGTARIVDTGDNTGK